MSISGESANSQPDPADRTVSIPLSMFEGLIQRVAALEADTRELRGEIQGLRERVGKLALSDESTVGSGPPTPIETPGEVAPVGPKGWPVVRLYSRLEADSRKPFSEIMERINQTNTGNELVDAVRERTFPYSFAFTCEMFSQLSSTDTHKILPPCPSFEQSPKDYEEYVKTHAKIIKWEETEDGDDGGSKTHQFALSYLPGLVSPDLVGFKVDSTENIPRPSGYVVVRLVALRFVFVSSRMVSLHMNRGTRVGRFMGVRNEYGLDIVLEPTPSIVERWPLRRPKERRSTTYAYGPSGPSFVGTSSDPRSLDPPLSHSDCMKRVDMILERVPTMPQ